MSRQKVQIKDRTIEYFKVNRLNRERRLMVLEHYGNKCVCCGETMNHIDGGGTQHRYKIGWGSVYIRWIVKNNYPTNLQILCHNCNQAKRYYGKCPHTKVLD
jgi:hypothetical protein